jgi:hypothetical protein
MKQWIAILTMLAFSLTACLNKDRVNIAPNLFAVTPSRSPIILSPTPILIYPTTTNIVTPSPSLSLTPSLTAIPSPTGTETIPSTATETLTPTFTITEASQMLTIQLLGCDTSLDLTHGMGEVTNAYLNLVNASGPDLTTVCATLSAADEGRIHPDKMICVPSLPRGYLVALKLTIDTTFQMDTIVNIAVTSNEGILASAGGLACRDVGSLKPELETIGVVQPIP